MPKQRGRIPNRAQPDALGLDRIIANTAHQLLSWGFSRTQVFKAVAESVKQHLNSANRNSLSRHGIELIYKQWVVRQKSPFQQKYGDERSLQFEPTSFRFRPGGYTKESLKSMRPRRAEPPFAVISLEILTKDLINNDGIWQQEECDEEYSGPLPSGPQMTELHAAQFPSGRFPITRAMAAERLALINASCPKLPRGRPRKIKTR